MSEIQQRFKAEALEPLQKQLLHANKQVIALSADNADRYARCELAESFNQQIEQNQQQMQTALSTMVGQPVESKVSAKMHEAADQILSKFWDSFQQRYPFFHARESYYQDLVAKESVAAAAAAVEKDLAAIAATTAAAAESM